jgi:hypothetical protein
MQFCEWLHQHNVDELILYNIVWADKACFMPEGVFNIPAVSSGHGIILMLSADVGIRSTSVSAFGLELLRTVYNCSIVSWIYGNCSTGAAWRRASSCSAEVVDSAWQRSKSLWERCPAGVECDIPRKMDWMSRANCMASLVARLKSVEFLPVETPEGSCLCSPSQRYETSRGKNSSSCAFGWTEAALNMYSTCEAPMVWSFVSPHHLAVPSILKTKCYRTYVVQYFWLVFQQGITPWRACE